MPLRDSLILIVVTLGGVGCKSWTNSKVATDIAFSSAKVPVSMTRYLVDDDGLVTPRAYQKVGELTFEGESCEGAAIDLSSTINQRVAALRGDAVVNLEIFAESASCTAVKVRGDVVAMKEGRR